MLQLVEDPEEKGIDQDHGPCREDTDPPQVTINRHQAATEQENEHSPEILVF